MNPSPDGSPSADGGPSVDHELRCLDRAKLRRILQAALIHDLKAPLNTATLVLDLLGRSLAQNDFPESADRSRLLDNVEEVRRELRRLSEGLPGLLALTDPGEEPRQVFDLAASLRGGLDLLRQQVLLRGVRLHRHFPQEPVLVEGRPSDLRQAVLNVVLNALEATPRGGEIHVAVESGPHGPVRVRVEDCGEGIAEADAARVFEPRFSRRPGQRGLGLPVARGILREHGGNIGLNPRTGGGTVADIELPRAPAGTRSDSAKGADPAGIRSPEVGA